MKHLSEENLQELRAALDAERDSLQDELVMYGKQDETTGEWEGSSADETGGNGEESDPTDAADQIEELVVNVPLVADLQKRMREVEAALRRMDEGAYGICEVCGEEIPLERLQANPAARMCIEHTS